MPKIHITKRNIQALDRPQSGQVFYWDDQLAGFGIKATKTTMSFIVEGQVSRKRRRCVIGKTDVIPLERARREAITLLGDMASGVDPNKAKRELRTEQLTVRAAFDRYFEIKTHLLPRTIEGYRRTCEYHLPSWRNLPISEITKQMVLTQHQKLTEKHGKVSANNAFRHFRAVYNFTSALVDDFPPNPVLVLTQTRSWHKVTRRRTLVPSHKLPEWWSAVHAEDETVRDIMLMALFTGMRRSEILELDWKHIDLLGKTITIPRTKNGDPLVLPLSEYLHELLRKRRELTGNSNWVFPSESETGHIRETKRMTARLSKKIGHSFCMHDLRRTFVTIAESLDIPHYALKRLLNHRTDSDVTGGYIVINVDRLRDPVERVAKEILHRPAFSRHAAGLVFAGFQSLRVTAFHC